MNRAAEELTQCDAPRRSAGRFAEICVLRGPRVGGRFCAALNPGVGGTGRWSIFRPRRGSWPQRRDLPGRRLLRSPVHDAESGGRRGRAWFIRDINSPPALRAELERASRLESIAFWPGASRTIFNNILTAVMGNITFGAARRRRVGDGRTLFAGRRSRATLRARDLTQQLLTFAKGGDPVRSASAVAGDHPRGRRVCAARLAGEIASSIFRPDCGPANADQGQLGQVGSEPRDQRRGKPCRRAALSGSVRPTKPWDSTRNGRSTPADYVHISVADSGTGVKPEHPRSGFSIRTSHQATRERAGPDNGLFDHPASTRDTLKWSRNSDVARPSILVARLCAKGTGEGGGLGRVSVAPMIRAGALHGR